MKRPSWKVALEVTRNSSVVPWVNTLRTVTPPKLTLRTVLRVGTAVSSWELGVAAMMRRRSSA